MGPNEQARPVDLSAARICVLYGGPSSEREVSLTSGSCVLKALRQTSSVREEDAPGQIEGIEIEKNGAWLVSGESLSPGIALGRLQHVDLFFLALHGSSGEDGLMQGLLALHGCRFTGSDVRASAIAMDKEFSRQIVLAAGVSVARATTLDAQEWLAHGTEKLTQIKNWKTPGWVVKPRSEGSSIGVSVIRTPDKIGPAIELALRHDRQVLIEELIEGIEVAAGIIEDDSGAALALPIVEICPKPGRFFDYEEKYSSTGAVEHCPPRNLTSDICSELQRLALLAHESLCCSGYSRSDFIVSGQAGPVYLETNTLPGMTPRSLLPLAAQAAGIDFAELCHRIAFAGLNRGFQQGNPRFSPLEVEERYSP